MALTVQYIKNKKERNTVKQGEKETHTKKVNN